MNIYGEPLTLHLIREVNGAIVRVNSLTRRGRLLNRAGKSFALAGRSTNPVAYDLFCSLHPVTARAWGLTRRPLLSAGFTGWVAGLK